MDRGSLGRRQAQWCAHYESNKEFVTRQEGPNEDDDGSSRGRIHTQSVLNPENTARCWLMG
eukprot:4884131-Alexandrium_andersonii.AAC.1